MKEYQVQMSWRAGFNVSVEASDEEAAIKLAWEMFDFGNAHEWSRQCDADIEVEELQTVVEEE